MKILKQNHQLDWCRYLGVSRVILPWLLCHIAKLIYLFNKYQCIWHTLYFCLKLLLNELNIEINLSNFMMLYLIASKLKFTFIMKYNFDSYSCHHVQGSKNVWSCFCQIYTLSHHHHILNSFFFLCALCRYFFLN